jgi:endoglucanase
MEASRMRGSQLKLILGLVFSALTAAAAQPSGGAAKAFARARHLQRGVNASGWFAQVYDKRGYSREHFEDWTTVEDIRLIKSLGFDHLRLSVNPQPRDAQLMNGNEPDKLSREYLGYLDAAVKMILDHDLAVVIDLHPESDFKARLAHDDEFVETLSDFWRALAAHYSKWDADRVFFEVLNEPEFSDPYRWIGVQTKLAAAIREGAPNHTIIAAGARWSDNDDLIFAEPLHDPNVTYNFHFYEPHIFTHQGATWGPDWWHWLQGLGYPSSPDNAAAVSALEPEETHRLAVVRYGQEHWDGARINAEISAAAEWARRRNVPLICDEFGVYRNGANARDREAWLRDVRSALEKNGIGWTMWDYSGSFGVVVKADGKTTVDDGVARALGLK